ncbi:MAG: M23 family metallopeptidase [Oscillospiraceae bacterium]
MRRKNQRIIMKQIGFLLFLFLGITIYLIIGIYNHQKQSGEQEVIQQDTIVNLIGVPSDVNLSPIYINDTIYPPLEGRITSNFGYRKNPISKKSDFHKGVDIAAIAGSDIYVAFSGKVIFTGFDDNFGNYIEVDHGNNFITRYAHCSELIAKIGTIVRKGDRIATVGSTGNATGSHLHFEIRIENKCVDPSKLLKQNII